MEVKLLTGKLLYSYGPYGVFVGMTDESRQIPHYLVKHLEHDVVEYSTDMYAGAMAWCQHFTNELKKVEAGNIPTSEATDDSDDELLDGTVIPFRPN